LSTDPVVLTFSGDSVAGQNHAQTTIDGSSLTNGTAGEPSTTTEGQTGRASLAILLATGVIAGTPPAQGENPTFTAGASKLTPNRPSEGTIRVLANQAAIDDGNPVMETAILTAAGLA
jgi:hypothetical protein